MEAISPHLVIDVPMEDKVRDRPNIGAKENVHGILIVILSADVSKNLVSFTFLYLLDD